MQANPNPDNIDQTETVPVLVTHLEAILNTLDRALRKNMAEDMAEFYRTQRGRNPQQSPLTTSLDKATKRIAGYLNLQDEYE